MRFLPRLVDVILGGRPLTDVASIRIDGGVVAMEHVPPIVTPPPPLTPAPSPRKTGTYKCNRCDVAHRIGPDEPLVCWACDKGDLLEKLY